MLIAKPIKLTKTELSSIRSFTQERMMALKACSLILNDEKKLHVEAVLFNAIVSAYFCGRKMAAEKKGRNHKPILRTKIAVNEKEKSDYKKRRK